VAPSAPLAADVAYLYHVLLLRLGIMVLFRLVPVYLVKGAGFSESRWAFLPRFPFFWNVGNVAGGFLCDYLAARFGLKTGRRLVGAASLAASALLLNCMTMTRNHTAIVVFSSLGFGVADLMLPAAWAVCLDIGRAHAGLVTGIMNYGGATGGFVCSVLFVYVRPSNWKLQRAGMGRGGDGDDRPQFCSHASMLRANSLKIFPAKRAER